MGLAKGFGPTWPKWQPFALSAEIRSDEGAQHR
jgi:hypothetical protein